MAAQQANDLLPNFTQAPNVFFDFWMADLERPELLVLLYLIRQTYGFHRGDKGDRISVHQFAEGKRRGEEILCRGTGLPERKVKAVLSLFRAAGLVIRTQRKDESGSSLPSVYRLNVEWSWKEGMAAIEAIRPQVYGRGGSDPDQGGGVTLQTPPPPDEIEVVVQAYKEGDSTDTLQGVSQDTPPLSKKERKTEIKIAPPTPPGGSGGFAPGSNSYIRGGLGVTPSNNTAKPQGSTPRVYTRAHDAGAKGGEAGSVPTALPLRGVAAGGDPRTPSYIEPVAGAPPQTPEGPEGAASRQETDDSLLTDLDRASIATFTRGLPPDRAQRFVQLVIEGRKQSIQAKGSPEGESPGVAMRPLSGPTESQPRPVFSKSWAPAVGNASLDPQIAYGHFKALAWDSRLIGEIVFWGIEKETARQLVSRWGAEKVQGWMEKCETKKDRAAYLMTLAKIAGRKEAFR